MFVSRRTSRLVPGSPDRTAAPVPIADDNGPPAVAVENDEERISVKEVRRLQLSGAPVVILDVRSEPSFGDSAFQAQGALRMLPDQVVRRIAELNVPRQTHLIAFCA
jgi:hypothetical protein